MLHNFFQSKKANISIIVALSIIPLLGAFGIGIDSALAGAGKVLSQKALDAAALAGAKINLEDSSRNGASGKEAAKKIFLKNNKLANCSEVATEWSDSTRLFQVSSNCSYNTKIMSILGVRNIAWDIHSSAKYDFVDNLEMVLVVDMSYRMCGDFGQQYESSLSVNQEWPQCKYLLDRAVLVGHSRIALSGTTLNCQLMTECFLLSTGQRVWWDHEANQIAWNDPMSGSVMTARHIMTNIVVDATSHPVNMEVLNTIGNIDEAGTKSEAAKEEINSFIDKIAAITDKYRFGSFKIGLIPAQKGVNLGSSLYPLATGQVAPIVDGEEITYITPKYKIQGNLTSYEYIRYDRVLGQFKIEYTDAPPHSYYYHGGEFFHYKNPNNQILPLTNVMSSSGVNLLKASVNNMKPIQLSGRRPFTGSGSFVPASADMMVALLWARNMLSSGWANTLSSLFGIDAAPLEKSNSTKKVIVIISEGYTENIFPSTRRSAKDLVSDLCEHISKDKSSDGHGYDIYAIGYQVYDHSSALPYGKELNSCAGAADDYILEKSSRLYYVAPDDTSSGILSDIMETILLRQGKLLLVS